MKIMIQKDLKISKNMQKTNILDATSVETFYTSKRFHEYFLKVRSFTLG